MTEEQIKAAVLDFFKYCEVNLQILTKEGQIVRFKLNRIQKKIVKHCIQSLADGKPIRVIILKARQEGVSTIIEALVYWWTATHKNVNAKIISHDKESAENLYGMFRRYYDYSEDQFKPATKYNTKHDLLFDTPEGTGLKSKISISSAENTGSGIGQTVFWLHASEVAMWSNGRELVAGLMQTVPMRAGTAIFLESTAKGVGDYFYDMWQGSKSGKNSFTPLFFGWHEHEDYARPTKLREKDLSEEELELKAQYGLTYPQIEWRRQKLAELNQDIDLFHEQYPINEVEAFLAAGRARFDAYKLAEMERQCVDPGRFNVVEAKTPQGRIRLNGMQTEYTLKPTLGSPLKVWEEVQPGVSYVIGADVSDTGEDNSVATVMCEDTCTTVARYAAGDVEPSEFGEILFELGHYYNKALVGVESNNHGLTTIQRLRDMNYSRLYRQERGKDERFESFTSKLGWRTDRKTKPLMIDALAEAIVKDRIHDRDLEFVRECITYVVDDKGRTNAQASKHDDRVMSTALALQLFDWNDEIVYRRRRKAAYPSPYLKAKQANREYLSG